MKNIAEFADFRRRAKARVPHFLFEYYDGAAFEGVTARRNEEDLQAIGFRQPVLRDVSGVDTSASLFGKTMTMPLALSPVGLAGMSARRGEVQAARAASRFGVPMALSTTSVCALDEVARAAVPWFQLYMVRDRGFVTAMMDWAAELGCDTLLLTVDLPVLGIRRRDRRSGLLQPGLGGKTRRFFQLASRPHWLWSVGIHGRPHNLGTIAHGLGGRATMAECMAFTGTTLDDSVDATALDWVRAHWKGKLLVKGVLEPEDARMAIAAGVDGIVVSNHGGRQLDTVLSSAEALPRVRQAIGNDGAVLVDGGIRSGLDILRMLALGADATMIGRPWLYALGAGGEAGVFHLLRLLEEDLRVAMALTGCTRIDQITEEILRK